MPTRRLGQDEALAVAREFCAPAMEDFERLASVFPNSGVLTRHLCRPVDWYRRPRGWGERMAAFEEAALDLLQDAGERALAQAGVAPGAVGAVVCGSTTGFTTPTSLEALSLERLCLPPETVRLPVFGLARAGGAQRAVRAGTAPASQGLGTPSDVRARTRFHGGLAAAGPIGVEPAARGIGEPQLIILGVAGLRALELMIARRNTRAPLARGGREAGGGHYPVFVALHAGWPFALYLTTAPSAVIATLGARWTTRVVTIDGEAPIGHGPYRWLRHPNYLIVAAELAVLALAFGRAWLALAATLLNLPLTLWRIRVENAALGRRSLVNR